MGDLLYSAAPYVLLYYHEILLDVTPIAKSGDNYFTHIVYPDKQDL